MCSCSEVPSTVLHDHGMECDTGAAAGIVRAALREDKEASFVRVDGRASHIARILRELQDKVESAGSTCAAEGV